jgi:hypothetical protein
VPLGLSQRLSLGLRLGRLALTPLFPTAAEAAGLRFVFPFGDLRVRLGTAASLFLAGIAAWCLASWPWTGAGLALLVAGHLPLWVRTQTTAPGGATPTHEEVWAPVEDTWLERVDDLEKRGARWDTTPWDASSGLGCLALAGVLLLLAITTFLLGIAFGPDALGRVAVAAPLLFVPLWLNGMRTTWNPSELRKKGEALAVARASLEEAAGQDFDLVPLLALREGRRGKYPVDARLMARPAREDASGFLGVQVQVAMNNVKGTDYPYVYAVILGKGAFRLPQARKRQREHGVDLVCETGEGEGVRYLVVRQHADRSGGWHTGPEHIRGIVSAALDRAREAWRENGGGSAA